MHTKTTFAICIHSHGVRLYTFVKVYKTFCVYITTRNGVRTAHTNK